MYADRAVTEMLNCTAWSDWNPEAHFLDTAELMHGVGAAYDAIYSTISPANRTRIAQGLATNGLAAYAEYHSSAWWWKTVFNWGGVCNGETSALDSDEMAGFSVLPSFANRLHHPLPFRPTQGVPLSGHWPSLTTLSTPLWHSKYWTMRWQVFPPPLRATPPRGCGLKVRSTRTT